MQNIRYKKFDVFTIDLMAMNDNINITSIPIKATKMASNGSHGSFLFNLHTFLAVHICSKWLYDSDLAALDSAVCNYALRPMLLALLSHNGFTVNLNSHNKNVKLPFLQWAVQRGVSIHQICLENSTIHAVLDSVTLRRTKDIIVAKADINTIHRMLNTAPLLQNLSLNSMLKRSDSKTDSVDQLKELCSFLSNMEIYNTEKVSSKFITPIDVRKLHRLVVGKCGSVSKGFLNTLAGRIRPEVFRSLELSRLPSLSDSRLALLLKHTPLLASISIECCKELGAGTYRNIAENCPQLTSLSLIGSEFEHTPPPNAEESAALVALVENCTELSIIELCRLSSVNDTVLRTVFQGLQKLNTLSIQHCSYLTGTGSAVLKYSAAPSLFKAEFVCCQSLTGLMHMCELFPGLEQLTVDQCAALSYTAFNQIFRHSKVIKKLCVSHTARIYGYDLDAIPPGNLPHLIELSLVGCGDLVDDGLENIARLSPNLQRIQLGMCDSITKVGIERFASECTQLRYICADTWAVDHSGVLALLQHCPLLQGMWLQMSDQTGGVTGDTLLSMAAMHPPLCALYLQYFLVEGVCVNALISLLDACPTLTKVYLEVDHSDDRLGSNYAHLQAYVALLKRVFPKRHFIYEGDPSFDSFFNTEEA